MTYYAVIGRADGDDDDSCLVTEANDADAAAEQFKDWINELNDGQVPKDEIYITYILKAKDKIEIVIGPWGL